MNVLRRKEMDRYRVFLAAARAWRAGYPHQAWEIVTEAGLGKYWPDLQAALLAHAREQFTAAIERVYV